jgi:hypothetical protein
VLAAAVTEIDTRVVKNASGANTNNHRAEIGDSH